MATKSDDEASKGSAPYKIAKKKSAQPGGPKATPPPKK